MQCCGPEHEATGRMEGEPDGPTMLVQESLFSSLGDMSVVHQFGMVLEKLEKLELEISSIRGNQERMENRQARVDNRIFECFSVEDRMLTEVQSTLKRLTMQDVCPRAFHPFSSVAEASQTSSSVPVGGGHHVHTANKSGRLPQPCVPEDEFAEPPETGSAIKEAERKTEETPLKEAEADDIGTIPRLSQQSKRSSKRSSRPSDNYDGKPEYDSFVDHPAFDCVFGFMIIANAGCIGAEVEYRTRVQGQDDVLNVLRFMSFVFCFIFIVELGMRFRAKGRQLLTDKKEGWWNIFDIAMVIVSIAESLQLVITSADDDDVANNTGLGGLIVRIVRMIRLLRIVRIMRFSAQLRLVIFVILESVKGLLWIILLLLVIFYVFSIIFTMGASQFLHQQVPDNFDVEKLQSIEEFYGTLVRSAYSCFKAMTGGQSWGELLDPLMDVGVGYALVFLFYIVFAVLVLLNIITMVFVEGAMAKSQHERDNIVERQMMAKRKAADNLKDIFDECDRDDSGFISAKEFRALCKDERVVAYMTALGIQVEEADGLFAELDLDASGTIEADEFVQNVLALVGGEKIHVQLQKTMQSCHSVLHDLKGFIHYVEGEFGELRAAYKPNQAPHGPAAGEFGQLSATCAAYQENQDSHGMPDCIADRFGPAEGDLGQLRIGCTPNQASHALPECVADGFGPQDRQGQPAPFSPPTSTPQLLESHPKPPRRVTLL